MKVTKTPIAAAVSLTLLSAAFAAQAQQAGQSGQVTKASEAAQLEQVVITGIRAARESSLSAKRNNDGIVEVITAEDVGKMPDKNVADSLQRLPGVNTITAGGTEGGFGDNDRISLRGTPPSLTYTMINGHAVGTGDWFILNQASSGRSVSYSLLPSELIDRVEVNKSARADLPEGGVAGTVNIKTRSPLNAKEQLSGLVSAGVVHSTLSGKNDPQLSGMINWRNADKTFGLMAQVFSEKRTTRRDGQEFFWWGSVDSLWGDNGKAVAAVPSLKDKPMSLMTGLALFESERKRTGGLVTAQFRPSKDIELELTGFSSKLDADNYNRNYITTFHKSFVGGLVPTSATVGSTGVTSISVPAAGAGQCLPANGGCPPTATDSIARPGAMAESKFLNLDGKFAISDTFRVETKVGTTSGKGQTPIDIATEIWGNPTAWSYSHAGGLNPVGLKIDGSDKWVVGPNPDRNGKNEITTWGSKTTSTDKETYAQADGIVNLNAGAIERVKFGARFTKHNREMTQYQFTTADAAFAAGALAWNGAMYPSNFGSGFNMSPIAVAQMPMSVLKDWAAKYKTPAGLDNSSYYKVDESTSALYAMADLGGDNFSGNIGVRVVNADTDVVRKVDLGKGFVDNAVPNSNTEILPSASFKFNLTPSVVLRTALSKNMARPDFGQLGSLSLDNLTKSGKGGNPNLKPIISTNFDVGAEWYFAPRSVASIAVFNMDVSSYVSLGTFKANHLNTSNGKIEEYTLTAAQNTSARVRGFEVALDMPLFGGFGFNTNYTYSSGKETSDTCRAQELKGRTHACDMLGNSRNSFNLGGYYEAKGFSARVAYNYRSAFLNGLDKSSAIYQDSVGSLMASIGYDITKNLTVTFDAKDINKPILKSFIYDANNNKQPQALYDNGAQYYLTLRAKF